MIFRLLCENFVLIVFRWGWLEFFVAAGGFFAARAVDELCDEWAFDFYEGEGAKFLATITADTFFVVEASVGGGI